MDPAPGSVTLQYLRLSAAAHGMRGCQLLLSLAASLLLVGGGAALELAGLTPGETRIAGLLRQRLDLDDRELRRALVAHPAILGYSYEANIEPKLCALERRLRLRSTAELKKVVTGFPLVLGLNYDRNIDPTLGALEVALELDEAELRKLLLGAPQVLGLSADANLRPTLDAVARRLRLERPELRRLVTRLPQLLTMSLGDNVLPTLDALQARLELSDAELSRCVAGPGTPTPCDAFFASGRPTRRASEPRAYAHGLTRARRVAAVRRLVLAMPQVVGLSFDGNVRAKLDFLQAELGLTTAELRHEVLRDPLSLGASLAKSLRPNVALWRAELPADISLTGELRRRGLRVLSCSHEQRTRPRVEQARARGVPMDRLLGQMRLTDCKFDAWLERQCRQEVARSRGGG